MIDNGYLFSKDDKRIFINTSLGCQGDCAYCYLPKLGYTKRNKYNRVSAERIIKMVDENDVLIKENTLITLGCFSECWDDYNKLETLKLIKYFLEKGNQVQLSTKKKIFISEIEEIFPLIEYYGQLIIYVSVATISKHDSLEKNTENIDKRLETFYISKVPVVLYIKPVIQNVTIKDLELYKEYIKYYNIKDVVVGSLFKNNISSESVPFLKENILFYNPVSDEDVIFSELSKICNVYRRSTEVVNYYRRKKLL